MTPLLPTRRRSPGASDEANEPTEESHSGIFQNAAESIHRNSGLGRNHGGRVATRSSHSCQWRRRFRKDTVRTGVPGSGRYTIQPWPAGRVRDTEVDEREIPIGAATVK